MISYGNVIYEYFDTSNSKDYCKLMTLNEQEQDRVLVNLATKLYDHIVNEITDIDFTGISESKGDITKIPNYIDMVDCINIVHDICVRFKESTSATDTLFKAIDNLKATKDIWQKSFYTGVGLGINTYNSLALAVVSGTSLLIATSIEYIKDPNTGEFNFVLDKVEHSKTKDSVLFKSLEKFNQGCKDGDFMKAIVIANEAKRNIAECELMSFDESAIMDTLISVSKSALDSLGKSFSTIGKISGGIKKGTLFVTGTISGLLVLTAIVIPAIRNCVSWFYNSKQKVSDYFAIQAALVEMNANNLRYNSSKSEEERNRIANNQMKWATKFKNISNSLSTKMKKAESVSKNTLDREANEKVNISDVQDTTGKVSRLF